MVTALASYLDARSNQGEWWLRIDDIDPPRDDPEAKASFAPMLQAHGLEWDGQVHYQSQHTDRYRAALSQVAAFPCTCSRKSLAPTQGQHPPHCSSGAPPHAQRWYSRAAQSAEVLWRKEDLPSYHLACAADEVEMGITHVIRGADLDFAGAIQAELIEALGAHAPTYRSIPLVTNAQGQKLSKQNLAPALALDNAPAQIHAALEFLFPGQAFPGTIDATLKEATLRWAEHHEN